MANWLEEEEHKQSMRRQEETSQSQKEELRRQREDIVQTHLTRLYDLCNRVNRAKPCLSIDRLTIKSTLRYRINWDYGCGGLNTLTNGTRGIRLSCQSDDRSEERRVGKEGR